MNQAFQQIISLINQHQQLDDEAKAALIADLLAGNRNPAPAELEQNGTGTINHSTPGLLEETLAELRLKRKTVELQARELEIEGSLEKVRVIAMSMNKADDMPDVCREIALQLDLLQVKEIRNVQTAIFYPEKGTYMNYEYYAKHHKKCITDTSYTNSKMHLAFAEQMQKGRGEAFTSHISGDALTDWIAHQKTTNVFIDTFLESASSLNYYWFSLGPVALGLSTYQPLKEEDTALFKRFLNVFELAYRRYLDIEKAVAQAREGQIQVALEKIRSRSLSMHKSDEIKDVVIAAVERIAELNIEMNGGVSFVTFIPGTRDLEHWIWIAEQFSEPFNAHLPYFDHIIFNDCDEGREKGLDLVAKVYSGKEKESYLRHIFEHSGFDKIPDEVKAWAIEQPYFGFSFAIQEHSGIFLNDYTGKFFSRETNEILIRFSQVFEQAYVRFLDLQKAEAQAREGQIQLALERVRAGTMAMHQSNELANTALLLFQQLQDLGLTFNRTGFFIWQKNADLVEGWVSNGALDGILPSILLPFKEDEGHRGIYEAYLRGELSYEQILGGEELSRHYAWLVSQPSAPKTLRKLNESEFELMETQYKYAAMFKGGYLLLIAETPQPDARPLLKRFAKVFEQAFTRFLDLQKAEAQTRESKIQLALERARTQSMIMQHSTELDDTLRVFHEQVLQLDISSAFSFLWLPDENADRHVFWAAWAENNSTLFNSKAINYPLDRNEPATAQCLVDWKSNEPVVAYHVPPASVKDYFSAWSELIAGVEELNPENFSGGLYYVEAFMKYGCFGVIVKNTLTDDQQKILSRFAVEFERAYTRFLDLQKAEAQAKEAQIEAALERVRSRTMAMQKSAELKDVIQVVYEQLVQLNIQVEHTGFIVDHNIRDDMHIWLADKHVIPVEVFIPYFDSPHWNSFKAAKENGRDFFANYLDFETKNKFYRDLFNFIPGIPDETLNYYFSCPGLAISTVLLETVGLYIENFSGIPYSDEENKTLMRFGKVFQQTYTRFNDLKQAEAQARESQIELSLERVRAKTMAMHNSTDVGDTAAEMVAELKKLGIETIRCGIGIMHEPGDMELWTIRTDEHKKTEIIIGWMDMHIHPLLHGAFESWRKKNEWYSYELIGDDLRNYYQAINNYPGYPIRYSIDSLPDMIHHNEFYFPEGILFAFSLIQLTAEQRNIFKRFAGVFGQTYRRYLDLKKAEAQAREAQIETALERIRSRTLAMQKSDELTETSAVLFRQLINLGIEPNRLYLSILKDHEGEAEFWITDEEGSKVSAAYTDNLNSNASLKQMYQGWKEGKQSMIIDMQGEELKEYVEHLTHLGVSFKGGLKQVRRIQHLAYFTRGFIGMAAPEDQPAETLHVLEKFAAVFNLTFTRFNDLKIAEAHAHQAEQDLIEIKNARKKAEETLTELQITQNQLIQKEKMASLGELTAGIAHEIQNPLNFVNNFSEVSGELLEEMKAALESGAEEDAKDILNDVMQNLEKINQHGKRADAIVKGMLQHSRKSSGVKEPTDINALCEEYLPLSYHGLRAQNKSFQVEFKTVFDQDACWVNIVPEDMARALLNLFNNAFYATNEKLIAQGSSIAGGYKPLVTVQTKKMDNLVEVSVRDNGNGIPENILQKIFQPFFTTKPTGQGTGLGLSLAYDIITKEHNGTITVDSKEGEGSTFIIRIPFA